jgi:DNA polymerase-1
LESGAVSDIKPRVQQLLRDDREKAVLSRMLATIATDVDCPFKLQDALLRDYDHNDVIALFRELEFHSLIPRVSSLSSHVGANGAQQELFVSPTSQNASHAHRKSSKQRYKLVQTEKELEQLLKQLSRVQEFAVDTETDRLSGLFGKCVGISIAWEADHGYFLDYPRVKQHRAFAMLQKIFEDANVHKIGHNIKYDLEVLRAHGIALRGVVFDTMIASYLLHAGSRQHSLTQVALTELGYTMQSIEELIGTGKNQKSMADVPVEDVSWYACEDADITWQLYAPLNTRIKA